jgi:hypothetical protein
MLSAAPQGDPFQVAPSSRIRKASVLTILLSCVCLPSRIPLQPLLACIYIHRLISSHRATLHHACAHDLFVRAGEQRSTLGSCRLTDQNASTIGYRRIRAQGYCFIIAQYPVVLRCFLVCVREAGQRPWQHRRSRIGRIPASVPVTLHYTAPHTLPWASPWHPHR